jgi:hypothetical protein
MTKKVKLCVRDAVLDYLNSEILLRIDDVEVAENIISTRIPELELIAKETLQIRGDYKYFMP